MATKVKVRLTENLGFIPRVLGYLSSIDEYAYGYRYYRVRHPGGIFNSQLGDLAWNLLDLITYVRTLRIPIDTPIWDNRELLRKFSGTLFAFTNYYNAAYEIILGCCKREDSRPAIQIWKWLKDHEYAAGTIYRSNLSEADFFLGVFNELKHSSTRFGTVGLTRIPDGVQVLGYYLECVDDAGVIIPNPKFHPNRGNGHTANSFNYDLRRLYYLVYKVAEVLVAALQEHFNQVYSADLAFNAGKTGDDKSLKDLFEAVSRLPIAFLPNEAKQSVPVARVVRRGQDRYLLFENYKIPDDHGQYQVSAILPPGDGFSRSWGLPYYRQNSSGPLSIKGQTSTSPEGPQPKQF